MKITGPKPLHQYCPQAPGCQRQHLFLFPFLQGAYRRRLAVLQPTLNVGVAGLAGVGHPALVGSIVNWSGGAGGVIPNTIFVPAAFGGHPVDRRWEIRPPIPGWNAALIADPFAVPHDLLDNGPIPVTAHGAHNLPAARTTYINALHRAGYVQARHLPKPPETRKQRATQTNERNTRSNFITPIAWLFSHW